MRGHSHSLMAAGVLALSGCSDAMPGEAKSSPTSVPTSSPSGGNDASATQGAGDTADPTGTWASVSAGLPVVLRIKGSRVELLGGSHCQGTLTKEDAVRVIRLKCDDGNTDRTVGKVFALTTSRMAVEWEGFGADSFRRPEQS